MKAYEISFFPKEAKVSLGKVCQLVHLTEKVNFPCSQLADGLAPQDCGKRFIQINIHISPRWSNGLVLYKMKLCAFYIFNYIVITNCINLLEK